MIKEAITDFFVNLGIMSFLLMFVLLANTFPILVNAIGLILVVFSVISAVCVALSGAIIYKE